MSEVCNFLQFCTDNAILTKKNLVLDIPSIRRKKLSKRMESERQVARLVASYKKCHPTQHEVSHVRINRICETAVE